MNSNYLIVLPSREGQNIALYVSPTAMSSVLPICALPVHSTSFPAILVQHNYSLKVTCEWNSLTMKETFNLWFHYVCFVLIRPYLYHTTELAPVGHKRWRWSQQTVTKAKTEEIQYNHGRKKSNKITICVCVCVHVLVRRGKMGRKMLTNIVLEWLPFFLTIIWRKEEGKKGKKEKRKKRIRFWLAEWNYPIGTDFFGPCIFDVIACRD